MYIIRNNIDDEQIIKNSRFITRLVKITKKDEAEDILNNVKKEYPKATHYCYAYIVNDYKKASDDGEPGGTAGMPILNVLEKEDMTSVIAIVVRYFGGIKLGAGGLVRAYSSSVRDALKKADKILLIEGVQIKITIPYDKQNELNYILKDSEIVDKTFEDKVTYIINCSKEMLEKLQQYNPTIIKEIYIEKKDS
jgi:hypothetical protein